MLIHLNGVGRVRKACLKIFDRINVQISMWGCWILCYKLYEVCAYYFNADRIGYGFILIDLVTQ